MRFIFFFALLLIGVTSVYAQCQRGYAGSGCSIWGGCIYSDCDNGGFCRGAEYAGSPYTNKCRCPAGFSGDFCETVVSSAPLIIKTKQIDRVIYGPGVPGITLMPSDLCGTNYTCHNHDKAAVCWDSSYQPSRGCICQNPCMAGKQCTQRLTEIQQYQKSQNTYASVNCSAIDEDTKQLALSQGFIYLQSPYAPCGLFGKTGCPVNTVCSRLHPRDISKTKE